MPYIASPSAETVTFPDKTSCFQLQVRVSRWASSKDASLARRASSARFRSSRSVFVPYHFETFPDPSRRGLPRKRKQRYSPSKRRKRPSTSYGSSEFKASRYVSRIRGKSSG